jgi:Zn-dependent protease with chaperone function
VLLRVMNRSFAVIAAAVCVGLLTWPPPAAAQLLGSLSEQEEISIGREAANEIEKDLTLLTDAVVTAYVSELGDALASRSERNGLDYTFKVVDSPEINAFALPGGFIYVNRGLLEAADNESEVAGVVGHEIGHVVARHGAEQVQRASYANLGLSALGAILGGSRGGQVANVAAQMVASGVFMKFGRDAEREADRLGAANVAAAGLDPSGMVTFFQKLAAMRDGQSNAVDRFFASHPEPTERVDNVQDLLGTLRRSADRVGTTWDFGTVKARLAGLPRTETAAVAAAAADAVAVADVDADVDATAVATTDPVPVTYQSADLDLSIAARFAPVMRQALGSEPRFDYIARFDFDGDWQGDNNWQSAGDETHRLTSSVYFNVSETETHYFVHYAAFHPRDYKGGTVGGVLLSQVLREAATRHGDYDPTGLAQSAVLAHENDMEGALVVVRKARGLFGRARLEYVETLAHNQFLQFRVATGEGGVTAEDERAVLYIEPKGHGIEAYHGGAQDEAAEAGFATYRYSGTAETPVGDQDASVGYDLVPLTEALWPAARTGHTGIYGGTFDYQSWTIQARTAAGVVTEHEVALGEVGAVFNGTVGGRNMARPPWGWFDQDETDQRQGGWFLTPAETIQRHFGLGDGFSTTYLHHPALGFYR